MLRRDFDQVLERTTAFMKNPDAKGALLQITSIPGLRVAPPNPLELWELPRQNREYLDAVIENCKLYWEQRPDLADDTLPYIKPYFGIAEHSSFLGGEVTYGGNTSYHHPFIKDYKQLDELTLDAQNPQFQMLADSLGYLKKRGKEVGFLASLRGGDAPMDIANAIRGNELFTDFYDDPESVHRLMDICANASIWTFKRQKEIIGALEDGVVSGIGLWLPGNSIGHLSEDATCLCSRSIYEEFGRPYTERVLAGYDGALLHTHSMGRHAIPSFGEMKKLTVIELSRDPNQPSPIEVYRQYAEALREKVVALTMSTKEVEENMEFLSKHRSIVVLDALSYEDAQKAVRLVRELSE